MVRSDSAKQNIEESCTVVFVTARLALTAAHCVGKLSDHDGATCDDSGSAHATTLTGLVEPDRVLVYTDEILRSGDEMPATHHHEVAKVSTANMKGAPLCGSDVALLELAEPLEDVTPALVRIDLALTKGEKVTAVGYGMDGENGDVLRRRTRSALSVEAIGETKSGAKTRSKATEWVIDEGPCGGDSGSPAFDEDGAVIGIMSRGLPTVCKDMVYSRVDEGGGLGSWIREAVVEASMRNGDPVPTWADAKSAQAVEDDGATNDDGNGDDSAPTSSSSKTSTSSCAAAERAPASVGLAGLFGLLVALGVMRRRGRRYGVAW